MPNIKIEEKEDVVLGSFDASDNAVLIPLLYKVESAEEKAPEAKCYTATQKFKDDFADRYLVGVDNSYIMAYELLQQGLPVVIKPIAYVPAPGSEGEESEYLAFKAVEYAIVEDKAYVEFESRNIFSGIKFITSGAWPNIGNAYGQSTEMHATLASLSAARQDAIALIEFGKSPDLSSVDSGIIDGINLGSTMGEKYQYAACNFPWATFSTGFGYTTLPACFGYLMAYSESVKSNANWFAAAGIIRGEIPNLQGVNFDVNEALMKKLQGEDGVFRDKINVIYNAGIYGYRFWGNKVFWSKSNTKDMYKEYLNVRNLLCDIKKQIYHAAMRTTFEPNDDITWLNFKSLANTLLDKMKSGRGLKWYKWTKLATESKATIKAQLAIQPIEAVESFDITIYLTDDEASVTE